MVWRNAPGNFLRDCGAEGVVTALRASHTINVVRLGGNAIGIPGASAIADLLKTNKSISVLDLRCKAMQKRPCAEAVLTLFVPYFRENNILCEGALAIAQAIDMNSTIKELNLSHNNICVKGGCPHVGEAVELFADTLTRCSKQSTVSMTPDASQFTSQAQRQARVSVSGWE